MFFTRKSQGKTEQKGIKHSGVHHWWRQRLTAIVMVPIVIASLYLLVKIGDANYEQAKALIQNPFHAAILLLLIFIGFWHSILGVQVIIEDYINTETIRIMTILFINSALILLAILSAISLLIILTA